MNHHFAELGRKHAQKGRDHKAHNTKRCILIALSISMLLFLLIPFTAVRIVSAQPGVQTLAASNVTDTSAQLNGLVGPNGMTTEWYFEWWSGSGAGSVAGKCPSPSGTLLGPGQAVTSNTIPVTCPLNGLEPSRTYNFRLEAR